MIRILPQHLANIRAYTDAGRWVLLPSDSKALIRILHLKWEHGYNDARCLWAFRNKARWADYPLGFWLLTQYTNKDREIVKFSDTTFHKYEIQR